MSTLLDVHRIKTQDTVFIYNDNITYKTVIHIYINI